MSTPITIPIYSLFPSGCHAAEVEIDPETGAVRLERYTAIEDYGRLINPMLTRGQVQGGLVQGIGQALLEHTVYDDDAGQLLSGSLMDYALPRADELPSLDITLPELPTMANPSASRARGKLAASVHRRQSSTRSSMRWRRSVSTTSTCRLLRNGFGARSAA